MLSIAKLQNLKAIHNRIRWDNHKKGVVINRKTTKFESNSQPCCSMYPSTSCCYQSQNYKIWKQFTTSFSISYCCLLVVINRKTTKFESNSQHSPLSIKNLIGCYQSQNYKIWKQFTTTCASITLGRGLLSIAKLQNLKAIHN